MPWNGNGVTVFPAAVLRSESLSHASVYSRKSRAQPARKGGAALASNVNVASSPGAMMTYMSSGAGGGGSTCLVAGGRPDDGLPGRFPRHVAVRGPLWSVPPALPG